jgi:hypothetical protein
VDEKHLASINNNVKLAAVKQLKTQKKRGGKPHVDVQRGARQAPPPADSGQLRRRTPRCATADEKHLASNNNNNNNAKK